MLSCWSRGSCPYLPILLRNSGRWPWTHLSRPVRHSNGSHWRGAQLNWSATFRCWVLHLLTESVFTAKVCATRLVRGTASNFCSLSKCLDMFFANRCALQQYATLTRTYTTDHRTCPAAFCPGCWVSFLPTACADQCTGMRFVIFLCNWCSHQ